MNLMFWKRKTGAAEETESAPEDLAVNTETREPLDSSAADQDSAGPESPGMETDSAETPAQPGLAARMKLQFIALTLRFRKTPAPDTGEEGDLADEADASPAPETPARPGLLLRIKAGFAAFTREFKTPAAPATETDQEAESRSGSEAAPESELLEEEAVAGPVRSRKWLVIGGSAFIVVLLAADITITLWLAYEPPQKRWGTRHDITSISTRPIEPESAPERPQAEAEALRQENAALQARIEALKKGAPQQRSYAGQAVGGSAPSSLESSDSGEVTISNKDPRAAALSLKEAVEAMNAGSGETGKKPVK